MNLTDTGDRLKKLLALDLDPSRDDEQRSLDQRQVRLTKEQQLVLVEEYLSGMTTYELTEQYSMRRDTAASIIKRHGVKIRTRSEQHAMRVHRQGPDSAWFQVPTQEQG